MNRGVHTKINWRDRKRICGMPLGSELYETTEDRLMITVGVLSQTQFQVLLHRVRDISCTRTLGQWLFGVGTIRIVTFDNKVYMLENIRNAWEIKEMLHELIETQKLRHRNPYRSRRGSYQWALENKWRRGPEQDDGSNGGVFLPWMD